MPTERLDRNVLRLLRESMQEALNEVGTRHGARITIGGGSFSTEEASFKIAVATLKGDGTYESPEERTFITMATMYGLRADMLGREYDSNGKRYTVVGAKFSSKKYPILGRYEPTGKLYKFHPDTIRLGLVETARPVLKPGTRKQMEYGQR